MSDERITRRAPHMERYVEVSQYAPGVPWQVRLTVGNQSFIISHGDGFDTEEEANWMRDMLCIALDAIVKERRGGGPMKPVALPTDWDLPKNEEQRVAQIVLFVIKNHDNLETIDWQIARAVIADRGRQET